MCFLCFFFEYDILENEIKTSTKSIEIESVKMLANQKVVIDNIGRKRK
jgi:hypothetical protein